MKRHLPQCVVFCSDQSGTGRCQIRKLREIVRQHNLLSRGDGRRLRPSLGLEELHATPERGGDNDQRQQVFGRVVHLSPLAATNR